MCLITPQQEPLIAEQDIVVFKQLSHLTDETAVSPFQCFTYILGDIYKTKIREIDNDDYSCFDEINCKYLNENYPNWNYEKHSELKYLGEGFHVAKQRERLTDFYNGAIYECIIPKGSEYYEEPTGTIVSNQIIIKQRLD